MTPADQYRVKAADMAALASAENNPLSKAEYLRLSGAYLRLAEQAERNSQNDVVWYDPLVDREQQQERQPQQQQEQPQHQSPQEPQRRQQDAGPGSAAESADDQ
jgi:hypothetical protein